MKKGGVLFAIDSRPYEYALQQALSDQADLEESIIDEDARLRRNITRRTQPAPDFIARTGIKTAGSSTDLAKAAVARAQAATAAAEAQLKYASNDLNRIEPLLKKKYVTVDQVDQAETSVRVAQGNFDAAQAALEQAQAQYTEAILNQDQADAAASESAARLGQATHAIDRIETLISQRPAKAAKSSQCAARPRTLPRGGAVRCLRNKHEYLRRSLRSSG